MSPKPTNPNTPKQFLSVGSSTAKSKVNQSPSTSNMYSFGTQPQQQNKAANPPDPIIQRLHKIRDSYNKDCISYRFYHVAYNISGGSSFVAPNKPACIEQTEWNKYVSIAKQYPMISKDSMIPSQICDFSELKNRLKAQKDVVSKMAAKLDSLKSRINQLHCQYNDRLITLLQEITRNSHLISEKMMSVLKVKEISAMPDLPFTPQEHELFDRLQKLENDLSKPNRFVSALNSLNLRATMIRESSVRQPKVTLSEKREETESVIQANHSAIEGLVKIITSMNKTTKAIEKKMAESGNVLF